jgi:hypothetical protein
MARLSTGGGLILLEATVFSLAMTNVGSDHTQFAVAISGIVLAAVPRSLRLAIEVVEVRNGATHQQED